MTQTLRLPLLFFVVCALIASSSTLARAQKNFDVSAGISTLDAPGAHVANGINNQPDTLTGGVYLNFNGDFIFWKNLGVEGEFVRKQSEGLYIVDNLPFRPLYFDANAIWTKKFFKRFTAEIEGGAGEESIRFYTGGCGSGCYAAKNHFMIDGGAGVKIYPLNWWFARHIFIRPEGRFYLVFNNQQFSSDKVIRYGASIGYTFRR